MRFVLSGISQKADLVITEAVYDVFNGSGSLNDGNGGNNGEYVIIANTDTFAVDVEGFELDDDGDATDGDGMVINTGGPFEIAGNSFLVFAGTDLISWETEYGTLLPGAQFFNVNDAGLSWQALNNGGDDISFTSAINSGVGYSDVASDGETILWNPTTMQFESGGNVSLTSGTQDYVPGTLSASVSGVPEPGSMAVLGLVGLFGLCRRHRKK